jgi:very-short-patch-repair endonuclease
VNITEVRPASDWPELAQTRRRGRKSRATTDKQSVSKKLHGDFLHDIRMRRMPLPLCKGNGKELMFAKATMERRWTFDFAWPEYKLAVEIEGLVILPMYTKPNAEADRRFVVMGRHASPDGIKGDMDKYNAAAQLGWYVLRFEQDRVKNKTAIDTTMRVLASKGWAP